MAWQPLGLAHLLTVEEQFQLDDAQLQVLGLFHEFRTSRARHIVLAGRDGIGALARHCSDGTAFGRFALQGSALERVSALQQGSLFGRRTTAELLFQLIDAQQDFDRIAINATFERFVAQSKRLGRLLEALSRT